MSLEDGIAPGIYWDMTAEEYHADPCPAPSLNSSTIKELCFSSPVHARIQHPKLNRSYKPKHEDKFDTGTIAHGLFLEGDAGVAIIDAKDWRTKVAKEARERARAEGKIPVLRHKMRDVEIMVNSIRPQLENHEAKDMFTEGMPEPVLIWKEGEVWCRARLDWLHANYKFIDDYKTRGASASPEAASKAMIAEGWDIQAAWYLRGLAALRPTEARDTQFRFMVQEQDEPFAISVVGLSPDLMTLAQKKCIYGLTIFSRCLETGIWPGYPSDVCYVTMPPWEESRWIEKEIRDLT